MKRQCKICGVYFYPDLFTLEQIVDGYITLDSVDTCDDCLDMLNHPCNDDIVGMISDADPGL